MNYIKINWKWYELLWLVASTIIILAISLILKDTLLATISSITGLISVVLCAKGKLSYLYFGIVQCVTYGYIAIGYGLYGEAMLNLLIFLPFNIFTIYLWSKNRKSKSEVIAGEDVPVKKLSKKQIAIIIPLSLITMIVYYLFLQSINAKQAMLDSSLVVLSIIAQLLLTFRYVEQWLIWIVINSLTIVLWIIALSTNDGNDYAILVMQIAFLINSIFGYFNWLKISKGGS